MSSHALKPGDAVTELRLVLADDAGSDFGGSLRRARERRSVTVHQIAAATKIPVVALEALERNESARLPGGLFSRAFVRAYAHEVGLDAERTVCEFLKRFPDNESAAGAEISRLRNWHQRVDEPGQASRLLACLLGVTALLLIGVLYLIFSGRS
jgi:cytoskeletal protein RodZ